MCNIKKKTTKKKQKQKQKQKNCLKLSIFPGYFGVKVLEGGGAPEVGWID